MLPFVVGSGKCIFELETLISGSLNLENSNRRLILWVLGIVGCTGLAFFCYFQMSKLEQPQAKCVAEKVIEIPLPQTSLGVIRNDLNKIILSFPVETGEEIEYPKYDRQQHEYPVQIPGPEPKFSFFDWIQESMHRECISPVLESNYYKQKESKFFDFDPVSLELKPCSLIPYGHKIESYGFAINNNSLSMVLSDGENFSAHFFVDKKRFILPLPKERQKVYPGYNMRFQLLRTDNFLVIVERARLMRWNLSGGTPVKLTDITLPTKQGLPAFTRLGTGKDELLFEDQIRFSEISKLNAVDLKTGQIIPAKVKEEVRYCSPWDDTYFDKTGRIWHTSYEPYVSRITCYDKDKRVFESMIRGRRDFVSTGIRELDEIQETYMFDFQSNIHTIAEAKNWNYPPTIFYDMAFDEKNIPYLLTRNEGLFRLENGQWRRLLKLTELDLDEISSMVLLPDKRICLFTSPYLSPDHLTGVRKNAIVIFDPVKNEYQIVRIKFTG